MFGGGGIQRTLWIGSPLLHSYIGFGHQIQVFRPVENHFNHWVISPAVLVDLGFTNVGSYYIAQAGLELRIVCFLSAGLGPMEHTPAAAEMFLSTNLLRNNSTLLFFWAWLFPPRPTAPVSPTLPADGQSWKAGLLWPLGLHLLPAHCSLAVESDKLTCTEVFKTKDF